LTGADRSRRPGGRTADVTRRINDAILELLVEGGVAACTFSNVAERAHVERSTLYRRYPDRWVAMIEAILEFADREAPMRESSGSFGEDIRQLLTRTAEILASPLGPALWSVGAALRAGAAPEHQERFWKTRLTQIEPLVKAAIARGEIRPDVDTNEIFAATVGAVHFHMLVIGQPVTPAMIDRLAANACRLYSVERGVSRSAGGGNGRGRTAEGRG
jgi:AcrR family transcriptional regulator